ncbi:hypothetical protein [Streptomyces sp. Cmuel-A718b]|uniref:hypothetical protein n=1 Tax=Streptomyces sp. Cmuel-A718b TaxID=697328 RepID=UPI00159F1D05|nr:hypothetical protein [Streptomyces sp. Cmuel-A718b]
MSARWSVTSGETAGDPKPQPEDSRRADMRRLPTTDILWASPICTEISPAGGTRRSTQDDQIGIGDDYEPADPESFVRTRATAYDVMRAAEVHYYKAILCENVTEFATDWRLFQWWRQGIELLGYNSQIVSVSSAHVGGKDNEHAPSGATASTSSSPAPASGSPT